MIKSSDLLVIYVKSCGKGHLLEAEDFASRSDLKVGPAWSGQQPVSRPQGSRSHPTQPFRKDFFERFNAWLPANTLKNANTQVIYKKK